MEYYSVHILINIVVILVTWILAIWRMEKRLGEKYVVKPNNSGGFRMKVDSLKCQAEREKAEKAERLTKKKEAVKQSEAADETKQATIQAALERAKAKKAAQGVNPKNTENLTPDQQQQVDRADAMRAKAQQIANERRTQAQQTIGSDPDQDSAKEKQE